MARETPPGAPTLTRALESPRRQEETLAAQIKKSDEWTHSFSESSQRHETDMAAAIERLHADIGERVLHVDHARVEVALHLAKP